MAAQARQAKIEALEAHAAARAAAAAEAANEAANPHHEMAKSPSDFSCHSYEIFVSQEKGNDDNNKEKMSIRSEGLESVSEMQRPNVPTAGTMAKVRKVSTVSSFWNAISFCLFLLSYFHLSLFLFGFFNRIV